ncbi:hypothetical protein UlMin_013176 [Ulmus minor]
MPTPVSAARQCLTDEAARALDDAVAVARRRGHAQTTSLHAVSALLALPSSSLRDACTRARSSAYSPRLQFRALELSVGVSLDRLPSSKSLEEPPVSNSLMAAIKRSQANQRRHPESFHLHQIHSQQQPPAVLKVELKHFILSILDDPIVSRVLGEAGFRSCDIKIAIVHPPVSHGSRFSRTRCPPIFLCNLTDSDPVRPGFSFPFSRYEDGDENCKRIGEVLVRKNKKNPLLIGTCASEALGSFVEGVQRGKEGLLPCEITGLKVVSIEEEIFEFVFRGGKEERLEVKLKELGCVVEQSSGPGVVVNFGDVKALVGEDVSGDCVSFVVSRLKDLLENHSGKLWLIGAAGTYETFSKLLAQFPDLERDLDIHILPITSSKAPSLLGSFVPFGGFFPAPSEVRNPLSSTNQCFTRCRACTEKYEQEVASLNIGSANPVAGQYSGNFPSWLHKPELGADKGVDVTKTIDDGTTMNARMFGLQKKWNEICQGLHHCQPYNKIEVSQARMQLVSVEGFRGAADRKESSCEDSFVNETQSAFPSPTSRTNALKNFPSKESSSITMASVTESVSYQSDLVKASKSKEIKIGNPYFSPYPIHRVNLPLDCTSTSSVTSVTTDLGLGTIYASTSKEQTSLKLQDNRMLLQQLPGTSSAEFDAVSKNTSCPIVQTSSNYASNFRGQCDPIDLKSLKKALIKIVGWQDEAISAISEAICCSRSGGGRHNGSNLRRNIWLSLIGPDKVGKKRIASALVEILYGNKGSLISVDLGAMHRGSPTNSVFEDDDLDEYDMKFRGKTVIDYLAEELRKKLHSVVLLENVDRADFVAQGSLSQAIKTGKLLSHGREISLNNTVFVMTSTITKGTKSQHPETGPVKFSEESILAAKKNQMRIVLGSVTNDASCSRGMNVRVVPREGTSNLSTSNKRKLNSSECTESHQKRPHKESRFLDLNLPVEEIEDTGVESGDYDSDSISEGSEAWLEEFLDQVDQKVVLKPFEFDALAGKIADQINTCLKRMFGSEVRLEIDYNVMAQILAAAWLLEGKRAVEDWVEEVLCQGLAEAKRKYDVSGSCVMRLVASGPLVGKERTSCVCLPTRINLN